MFGYPIWQTSMVNQSIDCWDNGNLKILLSQFYLGTKPFEMAL